MKSSFSFAAVMSVVARHHLCDDASEERELVELLAGRDVKGGEEDSALYRKVQEELFRQLPALGLDSGPMHFALGELVLRLNYKSGNESDRSVMKRWLFNQAQRLGVSPNRPIRLAGRLEKV